VRIQQVTDDIAESLNIKPPQGALVAGVDEEGPAKPAGIESGDVIVKVLPWEDWEEYQVLLTALVAEYAPRGPTEEHLVEESARPWTWRSPILIPPISPSVFEAVQRKHADQHNGYRATRASPDAPRSMRD
jgi:hypothetical protein